MLDYSIESVVFSESSTQIKILQVKFTRVKDNQQLSLNTKFDKTNDIVAIALINRIKKEIYLVSQLRPAQLLDNIEEPPLEAIIGVVESNQSSEDAAVIEIKEETGACCVETHKILDCYRNPVESSSKVHFYYAEIERDSIIDSNYYGNLDEGESIRVHAIGFDELSEYIASNRITDLTTLMLLNLIKPKISW